jgi:hypothetical protein
MARQPLAPLARLVTERPNAQVNPTDQETAPGRVHRWLITRGLRTEVACRRSGLVGLGERHLCASRAWWAWASRPLIDGSTWADEPNADARGMKGRVRVCQ